VSQSAGEAAPLQSAGQCLGCGQGREEVQPIEALASLRLVQRRSATLARLGQSDAARTASPSDPASASGAAAASRIPVVLDHAERRLRRLFGEPEPLMIVRGGEGGEGGPTNVTIALASVSEVAERLVRTIASATAEDWHQRRPGEDLSAAEITWAVLHQATHYLEEVELALAQESAIVAINRFAPKRG